MVHPRKILLIESWGSHKIFNSTFFFGFGTIIDGAKGGSVTAKIFIWVKLVRVNSI